MTAQPDSMERIVPHELDPDEATGSETLALHLDRYRFAAAHAVGPRLLDLACGVAYGSRLLADAHPESRVIAADLSTEALREARQSYQHASVHLLRGDGATWCRSGAFNTIVSLETIEHVAAPEALVAQFVSALAPGGHLIASVPVTPSVDANPHHRTDFSPSSFRGLGRAHGLDIVAELGQVQPFSPIAVLGRRERRSQGLRPQLLAYYAAHPSALLRRIGATLRYGFTNRYLTVAWRKPER